MSIEQEIYVEGVWTQYPYPTKSLDLAVKFGYIGSRLNADALLMLDKDRMHIASAVCELNEIKSQDIKVVFSTHIKILKHMREYFPKWYVFVTLIDNDRSMYKSHGLFEFEWYAPSLGKAHSSKIVRFETIFLATLYANLNFNAGTMAAVLGKPYKDYYYAAYRLYTHVVAVQIHLWPLRNERILPFEATKQGGEFGRQLCLIILQNKALEVAKIKLYEVKENGTNGDIEKWLACVIELSIWLYMACREFEGMYISRLKDYKAIHPSYDYIGSKLKLETAYLIFIISATIMESQSKHANCIVLAKVILDQKEIENRTNSNSSSLGIFGTKWRKGKINRYGPPVFVPKSKNNTISNDSYTITKIHDEADRLIKTNDSVWYASTKTADSTSPWSLVPYRKGKFFKADDMTELNSLGFTATELTDICKLLRR
jgi:hypothetical protein